MRPIQVTAFPSVFWLLVLTVLLQGCRAVSSDLAPAPSPTPTAIPVSPSGPSEDGVDFG